MGRFDGPSQFPSCTTNEHGKQTPSQEANRLQMGFLYFLTAGGRKETGKKDR